MVGTEEGGESRYIICDWWHNGAGVGRTKLGG